MRSSMISSRTGRRSTSILWLADAANASCLVAALISSLLHKFASGTDPVDYLSC